jgi:hypothetical protein
MNDQDRRMHEAAEWERGIAARDKRMRDAERKIRDDERIRERRRVLALVIDVPREDDTGFCDGGLI